MSKTLKTPSGTNSAEEKIATPAIVPIDEQTTSRSISDTAALVKSFVNTAKSKVEPYATSIKLKTIVEALFGKEAASEGPVVIAIALITNVIYQRKLDADGDGSTKDSLPSDLARVGSTILSLLPQIFSSIGGGGFSSLKAAIGLPADFEKSVDLGIQIGKEAARLSNANSQDNSSALANPAPTFIIKNAAMAVLYASYTLAGDGRDDA